MEISTQKFGNANLTLVGRGPSPLHILDQQLKLEVMMSLAQPGNLQLQSYRGNNRSSPPQYDEKTFFWLMLYGVRILLYRTNDQGD